MAAKKNLGLRSTKTKEKGRNREGEGGPCNFWTTQFEAWEVQRRQDGQHFYLRGAGQPF